MRAWLPSKSVIAVELDFRLAGGHSNGTKNVARHVLHTLTKGRTV